MPSPWRISEALSLALHGTTYLAAHPKERISVGTISRNLGFSEGHLWRVMGRLAKDGIVRAVRGPKGGFSLAKSADDIALLEIYEAIEGPLELMECMLQTPVCKKGKCLFGGIPKAINWQIKSYLEKTRLSDVADTYGGKK